MRAPRASAWVRVSSRKAWAPSPGRKPAPEPAAGSPCRASSRAPRAISSSRGKRPSVPSTRAASAIPVRSQRAACSRAAKVAPSQARKVALGPLSPKAWARCPLAALATLLGKSRGEAPSGPRGR